MSAQSSDGGRGPTGDAEFGVSGPPAGQHPLCSRKGCRAAATTDLRWRNPRLHDAARVKHWLACDEHSEFLADFLARRGFLLGRAGLPDPPGPPPSSR